VTLFVLDNSVTMRWFFDSGTHVYADAILADLQSLTNEAVVPILWRYETSAVLRAKRAGERFRRRKSSSSWAIWKRFPSR
jgi:hypothetical protein